MKVLGVITARGGSKGIPGKNLKLLGGRPLIAYTIDAAQQSNALDRLILSTDDPAIAEAARALGCEVPFLRPPELARDDTPHLPVMQHAVEWLAAHDSYHPDLVLILQPTSPLRRAEHMREAVSLAQTSAADSVVGVSAVPVHYHPLRTLRVDAGRHGDPFRHRRAGAAPRQAPAGSAGGVGDERRHLHLSHEHLVRSGAELVRRALGGLRHAPSERPQHRRSRRLDGS